MLSLQSNWAGFLHSPSLYLAHHCAIWICVYYPFAIILSSPLRLALFKSRMDLAASVYMTGDMRSSCKNRNQIPRRSTKKKRDMFQRLKVPLGFARYVLNRFKYSGSSAVLMWFSRKFTFVDLKQNICCHDFCNQFCTYN